MINSNFGHILYRFRDIEHFNSTSSQIQWLGLDRQEYRYVQYEHQKKIQQTEHISEATLHVVLMA